MEIKRQKDPHILLRKVLQLAKQYSDEQISSLRKEIANEISSGIKSVSESIPAPTPIPMEEIANFVLSKIPKNEETAEPTENEQIAVDDIIAIVNKQLKEAEANFAKTGDTIVITEAPQKIIEKIKEVHHTTTTNIPVDYESIYKFVEERLDSYSNTIRARGGTRAIRLLSDVNLSNVPQDTNGNYLLGRPGFLTVTNNDFTQTDYYYYGGTNVAGVFKVNRHNLTDGTLNQATGAWIDRYSLVYT